MPARHTSSLGTCPSCDGSITEHDVLIAYETADGPDMYADCPHCREVVTPV